MSLNIARSTPASMMLGQGIGALASPSASTAANGGNSGYTHLSSPFGGSSYTNNTRQQQQKPQQSSSSRTKPRSISITNPKMDHQSILVNNDQDNHAASRSKKKKKTKKKSNTMATTTFSPLPLRSSPTSLLRMGSGIHPSKNVFAHEGPPQANDHDGSFSPTPIFDGQKQQQTKEKSLKQQSSPKQSSRRETTPEKQQPVSSRAVLDEIPSMAPLSPPTTQRAPAAATAVVTQALEETPKDQAGTTSTPARVNPATSPDAAETMSTTPATTSTTTTATTTASDTVAQQEQTRTQPETQPKKEEPAAAAAAETATVETTITETTTTTTTTFDTTELAAAAGPAAIPRKEAGYDVSTLDDAPNPKHTDFEIVKEPTTTANETTMNGTSTANGAGNESTTLSNTVSTKTTTTTAPLPVLMTTTTNEPASLQKNLPLPATTLETKQKIDMNPAGKVESDHDQDKPRIVTNADKTANMDDEKADHDTQPLAVNATTTTTACAGQNDAGTLTVLSSNTYQDDNGNDPLLLMPPPTKETMACWSCLFAWKNDGTK